MSEIIVKFPLQSLPEEVQKNIRKKALRERKTVDQVIADFVIENATRVVETVK